MALKSKGLLKHLEAKHVLTLSTVASAALTTEVRTRRDKLEMQDGQALRVINKTLDKNWKLSIWEATSNILSVSSIRKNPHLDVQFVDARMEVRKDGLVVAIGLEVITNQCNC